MPPKKAAAAAAPAKEAKEKKPAAAPAHGSYKGQLIHHYMVASASYCRGRCRVSKLTRVY